MNHNHDKEYSELYDYETASAERSRLATTADMRRCPFAGNILDRWH